MTWTRDHAEALALLATQVRAETSGARQWNRDDIRRELAKLRTQPLGAVICATTRCAMDPGANRPECISSPGSHWSDTKISTPPRPTPPREHRCSVCSRSREDCRGDDHEFVSAAQAIRAATTIAEDLAADIKRQIAEAQPPTPVERSREANERVEAARAALVAANPGLASPVMREPQMDHDEVARAAVGSEA